jgi:hypothetical protein
MEMNIENVTKTIRCRRCGQLKPAELMGWKHKEKGQHSDSCIICLQRLNRATDDRKKRGFPSLNGKRYACINKMLAFSGLRMCLFCGATMDAGKFSKERPDECPDCYDRWNSEIPYQSNFGYREVEERLERLEKMIIERLSPRCNTTGTT